MAVEKITELISKHYDFTFDDPVELDFFPEIESKSRWVKHLLFSRFSHFLHLKMLDELDVNKYLLVYEKVEKWVVTGYDVNEEDETGEMIDHGPGFYNMTFTADEIFAYTLNNFGFSHLRTHGIHIRDDTYVGPEVESLDYTDTIVGLGDRPFMLMSNKLICQKKDVAFFKQYQTLPGLDKTMDGLRDANAISHDYFVLMLQSMFNERVQTTLLGVPDNLIL